MLREFFVAFRYEWFGDLVSANQQFEDLRDKYGKIRDQRLWYVMAKSKIRELAKKVANVEKKRTEIVKEKVDELKDPAIPREKKMAISLDIQDLYGKDENMQKYVTEAKKIMNPGN